MKNKEAEALIENAPIISNLGNDADKNAEVFTFEAAPSLEDAQAELNAYIQEGRNKSKRQGIAYQQAPNPESPTSKGNRNLSIDAKTNAVALKFYDEQLADGVEAFINAVKSHNKDNAYIIAILHNRDERADGVWQSAKIKPHWHVLIKFKAKKYVRVYQILRQLHIYFEKGVDDELLAGGAIQTIGSFNEYVIYLTHETSKAIAAGKEIYDINEYVSNLSEEEIKQIRQGYSSITSESRITPVELAKLDAEAFELGKNLGNFTSWYGSQPFSVRSHAKMKTIRESYERGVQERMETDNEVNRLCIFIRGTPNTGKTYTAKKALEKQLSGRQILTVGGGGSGKFDNLRPDIKAILIDDDICPNLLNISDNYICRAYRRNSNNPVWAGDKLIVTSNLMFDEWLEACGIKQKGHIEAANTRFFVCSIEQENAIKRLALASASTRGSIDEQIKRIEEFARFQFDFNQIIAGYRPDTNKLNLDAMVDEVYAQYSIDAPKNIECLKNHIQDKVSYEEWKQEEGCNAPLNEYEEQYVYSQYNEWLNRQESLKQQLGEAEAYAKLKSTYPTYEPSYIKS